MFIGRERELEVLRSHYGSDSFEFIGVYGRRRVGKTTLINEFARGLPTLFFTAVEDSAEANLRGLCSSIYLYHHPDADPLGAPLYPDFTAAFDAAFAIGSKKRAVLVIDEFPYLAKADTAVPSILQRAIDRAVSEGSQLFLILCGSSLSFMKKQLLDRKSPLYGRRTGQIVLKPFDFFDSLAFFPGADAADAAQLFAMGGGVPLYLEQFDAHSSLEENIARTFLDPSSILYEEPANLLKQEVTKAASYNAVLYAMAGGKSRVNEIATTAHLSTSEASYYLKELRRIGLVERVEPIVGPVGRAIYRVSDGLFAFWYRFVWPYRSLIEHGRGELVSKRIVDAMPGFMGSVFEGICRSWLWRELGHDDFVFTDVGSWWGTDPRTRQREELDVVAVDEHEVVLVGECKWRNQPTGAEVLKKLDERASLVGASEQVPRFVFSRLGFTAGCEELARDLPDARLVTLAQMVEGVQEAMQH